ncbi:uncharacterized protein Z518_08933 [Rhinocladiella mackenziei CBS 650.93]|uniref:Rhinocladiella mackenziei CBS 650.93 unplaced genomic scaffold supercont1.7, whole genome shotgun sequence n=1 Tax=Rhinocladiella mackenziei CBS 650.93 TaxID=1442369 RepID=A0A0D2GS97_9EURO|nr:uncharacterized protein Z518_08933 [Rhinocladiella mackenziei CBS 650.93]KIX01208.1 hypothetical protein Z518_08933 [Rhinocladiella mackenziei CBS 650.93]
MQTTDIWTEGKTCKVLVKFSKHDEKFTKVVLSMTGLPDNWLGYEHKAAWTRILHEIGSKCWNNTGKEDRLATGWDGSEVTYPDAK